MKIPEREICLILEWAKCLLGLSSRGLIASFEILLVILKVLQKSMEFKQLPRFFDFKNTVNWLLIPFNCMYRSTSIGWECWENIQRCWRKQYLFFVRHNFLFVSAIFFPPFFSLSLRKQHHSLISNRCVNVGSLVSM